MKFNLKNNIVTDKDGRELVEVEKYGNRTKLRRLSACTVGEYFAVLSWMMDKEDE